MKQKLQCSQCKRAKKGEPLYRVDDEILCVYCGMALMTELSHTNVEFVGNVTGGIRLEECESVLVKDTLDYINRLKAECADKERYTIELYNRTRTAEDKVKEIGFLTAKEIFRKLKVAVIGTGKDIGLDGIKVIARDFCVEVDE